MKMKYADGGEVDNQRNKEIAQAILQQLGGGNRLIMMVGAYNFVIIPNGVAFRIKNPKANYIKITLNGLDLYNLEVGRVRGNTYKVVAKHDNIYNDMLKPLIEKSTGMYLSLYEKGGAMKNKMAKGGVTEHGLRKGDTITDDMFWSNEAVVRDAKDMIKAVRWLKAVLWKTIPQFLTD